MAAPAPIRAPAVLASRSIASFAPTPISGWATSIASEQSAAIPVTRSGAGHSSVPKTAGGTNRTMFSATSVLTCPIRIRPRPQSPKHAQQLPSGGSRSNVATTTSPMLTSSRKPSNCCARPGNRFRSSHVPTAATTTATSTPASTRGPVKSAM